MMVPGFSVSIPVVSRNLKNDHNGVLMAVKLKPHHDLAAIQAKFQTARDLEITRTATRNAQALGYSLEDVVEVIQALKKENFRKSETAHSPNNPRNWHDSYIVSYDYLELYLKFAGETLIDLVLTSFKESQDV